MDIASENSIMVWTVIVWVDMDRMDIILDGWMNGRMDGRTDEWMDG